jgi:hypothetical protein
VPIDFVQSKSGGHDGAGSVTLDSPTVVGNRVVVSIAGNVSIGTPAGWAKDSGANPVLGCIFSKPAVDGETTLATFGAAGNNSYEWDAFELVGIDPDAPVDVIPPSAGTAGSTGVTAASTTYDGVAIGIHRSAGTAGGTTVPTFDTHTTGEELSDHGHATGGAFVPVALSTCRQFIQSLGTWTCTCTASLGSEFGAIVVYSAEGAQREAVIDAFWSFPAELIGATGLASAASGSRYWETETGTPEITADGLKLAATAAAEAVTAPSITTAATLVRSAVVQIKFRFGSLPGADLDLADMVASAGASGTPVLRYRTASQKLGIQIGAGAEVLSDATVSAGVDYTVDFRLIGHTTAYRLDWQIDDGSGPVTQTQATNTAGGTLTSWIPRLGWTAASTGDVRYRHALFSKAAGHYPLGAFVFPFLKVDPATTPTISGTSTNFGVMTANGTVAAWNATNARNAVDDWPPVIGASADAAVATAAHATDYIEFPMQTYDASGTGSIRTVRALAPMWAAAATVATCRITGYDGTTAATLFAEADPGADTTSPPVWICKLWRPSGGWTQAKLDAAVIRFGSNDATPDIGPHAVGMEAVVQVAAVEAMIGESGGLLVDAAKDPVTGGVLGVTVETPADQGATLNWEAGGVPGSQAVGAGSAHTETFDAVDSTTVTFVEVVSDAVTPPEEY